MSESAPQKSPSPEELDFIEQVGSAFERNRHAPMVGRILGWLLICDPPHQSSTDLMEALQASQGSISSSVQVLVEMGWAERVRIPGQRQRFVRLQDGIWLKLYKRMIDHFSMYETLAEQGLVLLKDKDESQKERLKQMHHAHTFLRENFVKILAIWEEQEETS